MPFLREPQKMSVISTSTLGGCTPIPYHDFSGGALLNATGTSLTMDVWHCDTVDGTYLRHYDEFGAPVSIIVQNNRSQTIPSCALFGCHFIKLLASVVNTVPMILTVKS